MKLDLAASFKEGVRVLMLINRAVQNSNKGSKRWINKIITTNAEEFDQAANALIQCQILENNPDLRLYTCVNPRKIDRAIIQFKHKQLDLITDNEMLFYKRINDSFCSCLMSPENRDGNIFLIDVDTKDLQMMNSWTITHRDIKFYMQYPTPNGWHYLMEPFNPALFDVPHAEIKKDALILLNWIES